MTLYHLKPRGDVFREFFAEQLDEMVINSSIVDPDGWIIPMNKADGEHYFEFILVYADNLLAIIQDAVSAKREVQRSLNCKKTR